MVKHTKTIPGFDGLRAIAVLAVFAFHINLHVFGFGWQGVPFFFVLSGFLITNILLRMKENLPTREYFQKFYGRRLLRIFPPYYLYLFLLIILSSRGDSQALTPLRDELKNLVLPQLPYAFFYVYDFLNASSKYDLTPFLTHFWSLAVEEQFYIFWPLVLFLTPAEKLKKVFIATILLGPIFRLITYIIYSRSGLSYLSDDIYLSVYVLPFSHVDAFALGAFASQFQIPHARKQLLIVALALPFLGYLSQYLTTGMIGFGSLGYEFRMWTGYKFVWGYSLLDYFFVLLIYNVRNYRFLLAVLEQKIIRYIGKISYGVYIFHVSIIHMIHTYFSASMGAWVRGIFAFAVTIAIAGFSYHFLERPILNLKNRFFSLSRT